MTFQLEFAAQWPDGTQGKIVSEHYRSELPRTGRDAYAATICVKGQGRDDTRGTLRFTSEAHLRRPGADDVAKANAVGAKLAERVSRNDLTGRLLLSCRC